MDIYGIVNKIGSMSETEAEKYINKIIDDDCSDCIKNLAPILASAFRCGYQVAIQNMIKEERKCKTR